MVASGDGGFSPEKRYMARYSSDGKVLHFYLSDGYTVITSGKKHCLFFKVDQKHRHPTKNTDSCL